MPANATDLVLDIGNTRTKLALFQADRVLRWAAVPTGDVGAVQQFLSADRPMAVAIGSVAKPDPTFMQAMEAIAPVLELTGSTPAPIRSRYTTPLTLGADRLANVVAAAQRFPQRPVLVIDLGSCTTYDLCEAGGTYAGGAISPGLRMRAKAMHAYSARLPLVEPPDPPALVGTTTEEALAAGIHHGLVGEIEGFAQRYGKDRPGMAVVLTGGDAVRFARGLENGIFAIPLLTLEGYHALLLHHRARLRDPFAPATRRAGGASAAG
jgi:type III pantothenate kinase